MKIPSRREFQEISMNHLTDIDIKDFMNFFKKCTAKPYSLLVNDTTLPPDNLLRFRKIFWKKFLK